MVKKAQKIEKKDGLEKILKNYKKMLSDLKDRQNQLYIEGELKGQIEN